MSGFISYAYYRYVLPVKTGTNLIAGFLGFCASDVKSQGHCEEVATTNGQLNPFRSNATGKSSEWHCRTCLSRPRLAYFPRKERQ